jgi:hypothetical protein
MHKARLFVALSALGVLVYCAPAGAQATGGPPDGPYVQVQDPPSAPSSEASQVAVAAVEHAKWVNSARLALGAWLPSLLQTTPVAVRRQD